MLVKPTTQLYVGSFFSAFLLSVCMLCPQKHAGRNTFFLFQMLSFHLGIGKMFYFLLSKFLS